MKTHTKSIIILFKAFTILVSVAAFLLCSAPPAYALPLAPGDEQYLEWGTYGPCHPAAIQIRTKGVHVVGAGKNLSNVPTDGIDVLECRPFDGPGGTRVVDCGGRPYTYCLLNENDGVGNHVFLGVRACEGPPTQFVNLGSMITAACPPQLGEVIIVSGDIDGNGSTDDKVMPDFQDDFGNTIEVWCTRYAGSPPLYKMYYTPRVGSKTDLAGVCPFNWGYNTPIGVSVGTFADGRSCILRTIWISTEGGSRTNPTTGKPYGRDGSETNENGLIEVKAFVYDALTGMRKENYFHLSDPVFISSTITEADDITPILPPDDSELMTVGKEDPADLNGDGIVDAQDFQIIQDALGSVLGESRFNPRADVDGDDHVTSVDLQLLFPVMLVNIDIKPGSFPNSINPRSKGVIPVAILTTDAFDATTVDPTTVRFGRAGTEAAPLRSALEDVDGDADTDMILHFDTQSTGIVCGDTSASLTGTTFTGQPIKGSDSINTVGCR